MDFLIPDSSVLLAPMLYFSNPGRRIFVLYLATSFLVALIVHMREVRLQLITSSASVDTPETLAAIKSILPKEVYTHRSAVIDYIYFIFNTMLYAIIIAPFAGFGIVVSDQAQELLSHFFRPKLLLDISHFWATVGFSILITLVADFGNFYSHYLMHRIPLLWEFHRVHHSAEVMTPFTVYRMHPLDDIVTLLLVGTLAGSADALVRCFITPNVHIYTIYGLGVASFLFFLTGYHLRHSHVWLSYGPQLSKILISPAQHQIHHSKAERHWDKNFGFIFAIWDGLFGSLYIPKEREELVFGIAGESSKAYSSPLKLYLTPFKRIFRRLKSSATNKR